MSGKPCIDNACGYCRFLEEEVRALKAQLGEQESPAPYMTYPLSNIDIDPITGDVGFVELQLENAELKAWISGGVRVHAKDVFGGYSAMVTGHKSNATLLLDEQEGELKNERED